MRYAGSAFGRFSSIVAALAMGALCLRADETTTLSIRIDGTNAVVSWPTNQAGYLLQEREDLNAGNWLDATNPVGPVGPWNEATVSLGAQVKYYRLRLDTNEPTSGLFWPSNQFLPTFSTPASTLDAIDLEGASNSDYYLFVTLSGLVNRTQPRLAVVHDASEGKYWWITNSGLDYVNIDRWAALTKYRSAVQGIVVFDPGMIDTVNLATTIAGVSNGVVADPSFVSKLTAPPYNLPIIEDLRGKFLNKYQVYQYLHDKYWPYCTHRVITGIPGGLAGALRDYIVAVKAACVYLDPRNSADTSMMNQFYGYLKPGKTVYLGWWVDENSGVSYAGTKGVATVASDFFDNGTVFSGTSREVHYTLPPIKPVLQNKIYVTFVISDGDNAQYDQHYMKVLWDNPDRGSVPIGWTVSPLLQDLAPSILNWYYKHSTPNDCLVGGPSAAGYCYPYQWWTDRRHTFFSMSESYFESTGLRVVTPWGDMNSILGIAYAADMPALIGITAQQSGAGNLVYSRMMPMMAFNGGTYESSEATIKNNIANASAGWDGASPKFVAVQLDAWHSTPTSIKNIANTLNGNYVVVRPDTFFQLNREAKGLPAYGGTGDPDQAEFAFSNTSTEGWLGFTSGRLYDAASFTASTGNGTGSLFLDGSDQGSLNPDPNAWVARNVTLATNVSVLSFDTRTADTTHGGNLRVRLVDASGVSHTLLDWYDVQDSVWERKSLNISPYAGQKVRLYFEQNDSGTGNGEYRYIDNVVLETSDDQVNHAFNSTASANGNQPFEEPFKAVDGSVRDNSKWCYSYSGDKWLQLDLGQTYEINRWVVKHAGAGGENTAWNTRDFTLEASTNGSAWTNMDTVTNNTADITDRTMPAFSARYVRLYITNSGADNAARIYEFEVHGPASGSL